LLSRLKISYVKNTGEKCGMAMSEKKKGKKKKKKIKGM
jgi:hypothetical protein